MNFIDVYQAKIYDGLTNNVLVIMGYVPLMDLQTPSLPSKVVASKSGYERCEVW